MKLSQLPRPLRFVLVGGLNTAISYGSYALLLLAGLHFALANFLSLLVGIACGFLMQGSLVFGAPGIGRFPRFLLLWLLLWSLNIGLIALLRQAGCNDFVAGALALVPVTVASYLLQRSWVFRPRAAAPSPRAS